MNELSTKKHVTCPHKTEVDDQDHQGLIGEPASFLNRWNLWVFKFRKIPVTATPDDLATCPIDYRLSIGK